MTVFSPSCALADAWATALFIEGAKGGVEMAAQNDLEALIIKEEYGELVSKSTPGFENLEEKGARKGN